MLLNKKKKSRPNHSSNQWDDFVYGYLKVQVFKRRRQMKLLLNCHNIIRIWRSFILGIKNKQFKIFFWDGFGFFGKWHINFRGLFNAKAILAGFSVQSAGAVKLHRLHLCWRLRPPPHPTGVLDMMVRLQSKSFGKCVISLHSPSCCSIGSVG